MANTINGSYVIPILTTDFQFAADNLAYTDAPIPSLTVVAESGGSMSPSLPAVTLASTATASYIAQVTKVLAAVQIVCSGYQEGRIDSASILPAVKLSSTAKLSDIVTLARPIPSVKLTSTAINGLITDIAMTLPSVVATATSHWTKGATVDVDIPSIRLISNALSSTIVAMALNSKNFALTEYESFSYNSLAFINGLLIGAKAGGIYELSGKTDDGANIAWKFKTGKLDKDKDRTNRLRDIWISYKPSGDLKLTVDDGVESYEYDVESYMQIDNAVRVKVGKGLNNRFFQIELENEKGETFTLDHIRVFAESTGKKR